MLTQWVTHLDKLAQALRVSGYDPVVLRGGMGARNRAAALGRLQPQPGGPLTWLHEPRLPRSPPDPADAEHHGRSQRSPAQEPASRPVKPDP